MTEGTQTSSTGLKRFLRGAAWAGAATSALLVLVATHLPAPRAVGDSEADPRRQAVRSVWGGLKDAGRAVADTLPDVPDTGSALDWIPGDAVLHFLLFLPPALFASLALGSRSGARGAAKVLVAFAAWAALDELSQGLTGRDAELGDWVANVLGALTGVLAVQAVWAARRRWARAG